MVLVLILLSGILVSTAYSIIEQFHTERIGMTVRRVLRIGHPILLEKSHPVTDFNTAELDKLILDMLDTMEAEDGAGLAAPQIGVLLRVVIFGITENPRYPGMDPIPMTTLINPVITTLSDDKEDGWEGCISVPGMRGLVPRYKSIRYTGYDTAGTKIEKEVDGFHARVVQHELDHLDGVLYPQRIEDMTQFGYKEELSDKIGC